MKITTGINPNCSDIIVRLNSKWGDLDAIRAELNNILNSTDLEIGLYRYGGYKDGDEYGDTASRGLSPEELCIGSHHEDPEWKVIKAKNQGTPVPLNTKVKDIEFYTSELEVYLFKKGLDDGKAEIREENCGSNFVLRIPEFMSESFPVILEAIEHGYTYYPDGGSTAFFDIYLHTVGKGKLSNNSLDRYSDSDIKWARDDLRKRGLIE